MRIQEKIAVDIAEHVFYNVIKVFMHVQGYPLLVNGHCL